MVLRRGVLVVFGGRQRSRDSPTGVSSRARRVIVLHRSRSWRHPRIRLPDLCRDRVEADVRRDLLYCFGSPSILYRWPRHSTASERRGHPRITSRSRYLDTVLEAFALGLGRRALQTEENP
ncbi:hypothetical protein FCV17_00465 [Mycobacterium avium subsp. hominissuis]|nr:hypothetical protein BS641_22120 [Mycobacterium avium subsp. hominissuis]PBA09539.1 hypothetical protein CKJ70_19780 [Mycobacterium avium]MBZ4575900.1 hypothetical protein [Mycobacterium avium subsp. hominissuis]PBA34715.1 hypothetical protein CKJ64_19920 [Mycobacterium avium]PBA74740.1 hypothetical protein CKJ75_19975 [Mycobacterium avium]